jgi:ankyrin repeat protein
LINSGASICGQNEPKDDSMLLKAVKANHINIVRLLLEHNVDTDEDSHYNRPNAVMTACQNENIDILRLLIDAKANLDTPSMIERKDECGMKLISLVHPVFVASLKDDESIFKVNPQSTYLKKKRHLISLSAIAQIRSQPQCVWSQLLPRTWKILIYV